MFKTLIRVSLCLWGVSCFAQMRPANQVELDEVWTHFLLNSIPKTRPQVQNIEARYWQAPNPPDSELRATITFIPYMVEDQLCLTESWTAQASPDYSDWEWGHRSSSYHYWKPMDDKCTELELQNLPPGTMWTEEPIPGAQVVQIYNGQNDLLIAGFNFVFGADFEDMAEARSYIDGIRSIYRRFQNEYVLRLHELRLSDLPVKEVGFHYAAMFRDDNMEDGPLLFFTLTPQGFVVHGVSTWSF